MTSVFADDSVFYQSTLWFPKRENKLVCNANEYLPPALDERGNHVYQIGGESVKITCYLKEDKNPRFSQNFSHAISGFLFIGYMIDPEELPDYLLPNMVGQGDVNGDNWKIKLLPVGQSGIQVIKDPVTGKRIRVEAMERIRMTSVS